MVGPNPKIENYRDDEVQPTEDRFLKKPPSRDFREVVDQVDEKRYREEEEKKLDKKTPPKRATTSAKTADEHPPSIFDLVKNHKQANDEDEEKEDSPKSKVELIEEESGPVKYKEKEKDFSAFLPERQDLSYVNPNSVSPTAPIKLDTQPTITTTAATPHQDIQEIIDRITKEVYSLEMDGKHETIVTLKGPLFTESRLILSEFDSARGQFNITIDNLTQAAKNLLDNSQNVLLENLSKKGYMVHIVTTTTTVEPSRIDDLAQDNSKNPNQDRDQQDRKNKEQR